jgi:hypothetical protein
MLAEAGCSNAVIVAITGHSMQHVETILVKDMSLTRRNTSLPISMPTDAKLRGVLSECFAMGCCSCHGRVEVFSD